MQVDGIFCKEIFTIYLQVKVVDSDGRFLCQAALKVGDEILLDQDKYIIKANMLYSGETDEEGFHPEHLTKQSAFEYRNRDKGM